MEQNRRIHVQTMDQVNCKSRVNTLYVVGGQGNSVQFVVIFNQVELIRQHHHGIILSIKLKTDNV